MRSARAYRRYAPAAPAKPASSAGGGLPLRTDEVARQAARLVVIDRAGDSLAIDRFAALPAHLRPGDLVIVNDAATLPASLSGRVRVGAWGLVGAGPFGEMRMYIQT